MTSSVPLVLKTQVRRRRSRRVLARATVPVAIDPGGCEAGSPGARCLGAHRPRQGAADSPPRAPCVPSKPLLLPRSQESALQQTPPAGRISNLVTEGSPDLTLGGVASGPGGYVQSPHGHSDFHRGPHAPSWLRQCSAEALGHAPQREAPCSWAGLGNAVAPFCG